ncbi:MAG: hypothetical protein JWQ36_1983, partial [Enterovirga sp.]|nr:hypothetical protein [Enterovirga sp.]
LLTGLSSLPAAGEMKLSADLKLSGVVSASLAEGRLTEFGGRFESSAGKIEQSGQKPIPVDRLSVVADWQEASQSFKLTDLDVQSGETAMRLAGTLSSLDTGDWHLTLAGRDGTWAGSERDPAFRFAELSAEVRFAEAGTVAGRAAVNGEEFDISLSGETLSATDGPVLRALIEARSTNVRRLLAFWPSTANPDLRAYLGQNLVSGKLDTMQLRSELGAADLRNALSSRPISDGALSLAFTLSEGRLTVVDGLPPLRKLGIVGSATGTTTTLSAKQGRVDMPDGRRLTFSEGSYKQTDEDKPTSTAQIDFRLEGGADALASFLRSPAIRDVGGLELDPATVKGRADLKVSLPLLVHRIPPVAELPISVSGTLSDISVERIVGREKLEGAQFALAYEAGALQLKGEGKLGGSPATFEIRQHKAAPGDVTVHLTLDEAARERRSLPTAPQVTGPVAVKLVSRFGPGAKGPTRVEADLAKASVDGLLPGWVKPAGRPGRITFAFGDGDGTELKDLVVESGPVQLRGSASFGGDGSLDKAELGTLKLSPGDDLRASVERAGGGYKVALRGNVGDARPVLKWITGPGGGGAAAGVGAGRKGREPPDLDIDAAINIVTGNNDEAVTGLVAKVGTRGRDLRALQLRGQFRSAPVEAQLVRDAGQQQQLVVRSGDAGATLRFLDLYRRMVGGELLVRTSLGDAAQTGTVSISSFSVRNEPALRSIASNTAQEVEDERHGTIVHRLEAEQVDFSKLDAAFTRSASRVEYKDVVVWGAQVGFTLGGYVDYARDRTEILGTFVPAYGLNNAFGQVPIVGLLLGGGNRNEGLFAIDFKVSGQASAPTLTVNPLTAVAPGILRKLFSWMLPEDGATGTTMPPPGAAERRPPRPARPRGERAE